MRFVLSVGTLAVLATGCSSVGAGPTLEPEAVADRSYVIDFASADVEINRTFEAIYDAGEADGMVLRPSVVGSEVDFGISLVEDAGGLQQMSCLEPTEWLGVPLEGTTVASLDGTDLPFRYRQAGDTYDLTLIGAWMQGSFSPDGSQVESLQLEAYWDATEVAAYLDVPPCDAVSLAGLQCGPCPDSSAETCLKATIDAVAVPGDEGFAFDASYRPASDPACD